MANDKNHHSDRLTFESSAKLKELDFAPSTPETIDYAMFNWLNNICDIHSDTSKGWTKVPVIWVGAERAHQSKANKNLRDSGGMLILPMMALDRISITKDPARKGMMPANLWSNASSLGNDSQPITIARRIKQDKTSYHRAAAQKRQWGGDEYSGDTKPNRDSLRFYTQKQDGKIVYETISMPMPSRVLVEYKLTIQADYHQQMNEILQGIHDKLGNHSWFRITHETHKFDAKMDDFSFDNNLATLEEEDRTLRTVITIKVEGYLIGGGKNDIKPKLTIRENAVGIVMPRESVMLDGFPVPERFARFSSEGSLRNVRQVLATQVQFGKVHTSGGTGGGGGVSSGDVIHHDDYVVLESVTGTLNGTNKSFTLEANPREGTLTVVHNGLILTPGASADYTISTNTITMTEAPYSGDRLVVSYVKQ